MCVRVCVCAISYFDKFYDVQQSGAIRPSRKQLGNNSLCQPEINLIMRGCAIAISACVFVVDFCVCTLVNAYQACVKTI